ncbi:hypothetical protein Tco_0237115 [Tanacetum coccineum]
MYIMTSRLRTRVFRPGPVWGCDRLVSRAKVIENQVMVAPIIAISSDTSEESVGSHALRVILFSVIPAIIPAIPEIPIVPADPIVALEMGTVSVVSPSGVLDLVDYSPSSDSDPSEDSLPPAPYLPWVSPFLCSDDTKADGESELAKQRPVSSSHDTLAPLSEFPLAPVVAPPRILRPIPARRLAWRRVSHHSSNRHSSPDSSSSSSSSDPSSVHSSTCDSSVLTQRYSEAFRRWRSAPLSTPYPPTTSESSLGSSSERSLDSSSPSSRPSRKRCRSPTASVPSPTHVLSEGVVTHPEDGVGMGFEITASDVREDDEEFEAEVSAADIREIVVDPLAIDDSSESSRGGIPDLEDTIYDIVRYMSEFCIDRITKIETTQRQLETSQMVASGERASLVNRIGSLRLEYLKVRAMLSIERDQIDIIRWHMALSQEEFR